MKGVCFTAEAADIVSSSAMKDLTTNRDRVLMPPQHLIRLTRQTARRPGSVGGRPVVLGPGAALAAGNAWELHHFPGHGPGFEELTRSFKTDK